MVDGQVGIVLHVDGEFGLEGSTFRHVADPTGGRGAFDEWLPQVVDEPHGVAVLLTCYREVLYLAGLREDEVAAQRTRLAEEATVVDSAELRCRQHGRRRGLVCDGERARSEVGFERRVEAVERLHSLLDDPIAGLTVALHADVRRRVVGVVIDASGLGGVSRRCGRQFECATGADRQHGVGIDAGTGLRDAHAAASLRQRRAVGICQRRGVG